MKINYDQAIQELLDASRDVLNFADIQRRSPDHAGAAMLKESLETLRGAVARMESFHCDLLGAIRLGN